MRTRPMSGLLFRAGRSGSWVRRVAGLGVVMLLVIWLVAMTMRAAGHASTPGRRLGQAFAAAWTRQDYRAMYALLDPGTRRRVALRTFASDYGGVRLIAFINRVTPGPVPRRRSGFVVLPVTVRSTLFGDIRGVVGLRIVGSGERLSIDWSPHDTFPGLRPGERLSRRWRPPRRGVILAADGRRLSPDASGGSPLGAAGAEIAGALGAATPRERARGQLIAGVSGLERVYDRQLAGREGATLLAGSRVVASVAARSGERLRTTIDPRLERATIAALGGRLGGIAVVAPGTGAVLALAGIALSGAQPPGSTFKIITTTAALQAGLTSPGRVYPVQSSTTLSGVTLRNANNESCGGTLATAFAVSCNSVFAPLGARIGAARLVASAEAFGFNDTPRLPDEAASTIPNASAIGDALAVGSSAIGQGRVLATPLEMATVAATVADRGTRARARLLSNVLVVRRRVMSRGVAGQLRALMLGVVAHGTGASAAIGGVPIAGKTGTAELRTTVGVDAQPDPSSTDAWFVAFPALAHPRVAVAVMLVGAGAGGASAAPIARQVLQASLRKGA